MHQLPRCERGTFMMICSKKTLAISVSAFLGALFINDDNEELYFFSDNKNKITTQASKDYVPKLGVFETSSKASDWRAHSFVSNIDVGTKAGSLGIARNTESEKTGPGAFIYLPKTQQVAVLDSENERITLFSRLGKYQRVIPIPKNYSSLGLSTNSNGNMVLLTRFANNKGSAYSIFEFNSEANDTGSAQLTFSIASHFTHFSAQNLRIFQNNDGYVIAGLSDNEFHFVNKNEKQSVLLPGFPNPQSKNEYLSLRSEEDADIQNVFQLNQTHFQKMDNLGNVLSEFSLPVQPTRLKAYQYLENGDIAVTLDSLELSTVSYPHEVVFYEVKNSVPVEKSRLVLSPTDREVALDNDVHIESPSRVFQLQRTNDKKEEFKIMDFSLQEDK